MRNDKKAYQVDRTPTELLSDLLVQLKFLRQDVDNQQISVGGNLSVEGKN